MTVHLHWYLPTNGDSREIVGSGDDSHLAVGPSASRIRPPTIAYLGEIARTAELLGFEAVLTPTGTWCEDAWITTAALTQVTTRLKFLVAFRPGFISPTLAAHQAATFQRISGGRLLLNIVTGGDPVEQARFGDHLGHDERYLRTAEFLAVLRGWGRPARFDVRLRRRVLQDRRRTDRLRRLGSAAGLLRRGIPSRRRGRRATRGHLSGVGRDPDTDRRAARPDSGAARQRTGGHCSSASGCTSSAGTPPQRPGHTPSGCSPRSATSGSRRPNRCSPVPNPSDSNG